MPIITKIDELQLYVEANAETDITVFTPSIRTAERRQLVPVLGTDQYAELLDLYNADPQDFSDKQQQLLNLCQEAVANIAMAHGVTRLSAILSGAGVRRSESDSLKTAYQYQERNLREEFSQSGFDTLEDILAFLDRNKDDFPAWADSQAFQDYKTYFIPSGIEFSKYYAIKRSRLVYNTISPIMRNIENFYLSSVIGKPLFLALKTGQKEDNLSDDYKKLLTEYICPGIAMHTIAKGMMQHSLELTENGVSISLIGRTINIETKEQATLDKFQAIINELTAEGDLIFRSLAEELAANPTLYPDYVAPPTTSSLLNINNKQEKSFFGV